MYLGICRYLIFPSCGQDTPQLPLLNLECGLTVQRWCSLRKAYSYLSLTRGIVGWPRELIQTRTESWRLKQMINLIIHQWEDAFFQSKFSKFFKSRSTFEIVLFWCAVNTNATDVFCRNWSGKVTGKSKSIRLLACRAQKSIIGTTSCSIRSAS